jgi:CRISPR/Cas system CMR subunit Cmr6 (Cas7 group RAMP superfamily)
MMSKDANSRRLRAILEAFDIPVSAVATVSGISRTYVSRVLSPQDALTGNTSFWVKVEQSLGQLVAARRGMVFEVDALPVQGLEKLKVL